MTAWRRAEIAVLSVAISCASTARKSPAPDEREVRLFNYVPTDAAFVGQLDTTILAAPRVVSLLLATQVFKNAFPNARAIDVRRLSKAGRVAFYGVGTRVAVIGGEALHAAASGLSDALEIVRDGSFVIVATRGEAARAVVTAKTPNPPAGLVAGVRRLAEANGLVVVADGPRAAELVGTDLFPREVVDSVQAVKDVTATMTVRDGLQIEVIAHADGPSVRRLAEYIRGAIQAVKLLMLFSSGGGEKTQLIKSLLERATVEGEGDTLRMKAVISGISL